ncbi:MAG TPA: Gfo/Idh/MocA family oxidoreductase [Tepidisphaeraceae bacterium]
MAEPLRWGIMGTGNIARQFTAGLASSRRTRVVAAGSRTQASAAAFAQQFGLSSAHSSYDALLADRQVDAVYLSLPNSMHHEWTLKSLRAGKHVLCEKPFATNVAQSQEMFDVAQKMGLVLVEAFMYRSHPQTQSVLDTIRGGAIGEVKLIKTSFCYRTSKIDQNIRFRADLHGGAMMDIGCYCLSFARLIAGAEPDRIVAVGRMHPSGVDEAASGSLHFPNGISASFVCGMIVQADNTASICGTEGYIDIPWPWKPQRKATYTVAQSTPPKQDAKPGTTPTRPPKQDFTVEADRELYALEADDFAASVQDGAAPRVAREDTLGNMRALDEVRRQIGLPY